MAPTPLRGIFDAYAAFGGFHGATGGLDSKGLVKLCKESGIIAASFSMVDTDLIHTKHRVGKKISFEAFEGPVIDAIAAKKKVDRTEVVDAIVNAGGPKSSGTKADKVRFADKSHFTGTFAHGGAPTNTDGSKDLSGLLDRSPADVRGTKIKAKH